MNRLSAICVALIVASGLSLVTSQYRARQLFIDLDSAKEVARKLDIEWRVLQLDQTSYSKRSLIEAAARRDLHMLPATPSRTQYIVLNPRTDALVDASNDAAKNAAPAVAAGAAKLVP